MSSTTGRIWEKQKGEPQLWFRRFHDFFLHETETEPTVRNAYIRHLQELHKKGNCKPTEKYEKTQIVPKEWWEAYTTYQWQIRLEAYAEYCSKDWIERQKKSHILFSKRLVDSGWDAIKRNEVLKQHFWSNYSDPDYKYNRTSDAVNVAKFSDMISTSDEKALLILAKASGIEELLENQQRIDNSLSKTPPVP
jgi:hypothetical protein